MTRRNPDNPRKTVNDHFYLPEFGAFGQEEYDQYNLARENLDRFLREMYDRSYALPSVKGYRLSPPEIDWFYSLEGMPHWRTIRGFWKFEQQAGDPQAADSSIYGHDGGSQFTARVTPGAWHQLVAEDGLQPGFFLDEGDSCIRTRSGILDNVAAVIPGILHRYPENPLNGKKELTIEFWWSPSINIFGGDRSNQGATYPASACLLSKINRLVINDEYRWISDELTLQMLPADPSCSITGGPLSFNTHVFNPGFTPSEECDFSDWGFAQSSQYKWTKDEWYYVVATWSEDTGMTLSVNLQQDPVYGFDANATVFPNDGIESNLLIGNYWDKYKTNQGIDALFSEMRISNRVRSAAEQAYAFNNGYGRRLDPDAFTMGLWHFDEGSGDYGFNAFRRQTENLPTFGVPGVVKKGYIYQPVEETGSSSGDEQATSDSSQEITYAAEFVRAESNYLDCGQDDFLNMQVFGGEVCYKFAATFAVKRSSTGTRQTVLSKWREADGKQYWVGFNENDQVEVRLGKGADTVVERTTELISNPYDYAEISGANIRDFDGVYVSEEGYEILNSSNSEEEQSWGEYGAVSLSECAIAELNGWYDFVSIDGNDGTPEFAYPYVQIEGAGFPAVDGYYVSQDDWDTARVVYEDPSLPFPNIKVENAQLFNEDGLPIDQSEESSSSGALDIDFNGVYVPEEYWTAAKDAILGAGAPDPSTDMTWSVTSNQGTFGVWRKVALDRDYTMFHAGDSWDGWILGLDADYNNGFYYSYRMKHAQPPITWLTMQYLGFQDDTIRARRSEEFYDNGLIQITKWQGAGQPIWRNTENPDLELYVDASESYAQWVLGIFETIEPANMYWAVFNDDEFPLSFYVSSLGADPGPSSKIFNYPQLQGGSGKTIWQNRANPDYYIYRDYSPWEPGWAAWFIGKGTNHEENYFFAEWHPGQTDIIPPSQWFEDYYGYGDTPVLTPYPLTWTVNGRPVYRKASNPAYCIYQNTHPDSGWFGWFLGKGTDAVNAMWWTDDNQPFVPESWYVMNDPDADPPSALHFYDEYLPSAEKPNPDSTPVADPHPKSAEVTSLTTVSNREAGIEEFVAISEDAITDTDGFHQITVSWSKHYYNGAPQIFIDGEEVSAYVQQDEYRGNMPYLMSDGRVGDWAPMNIGRTFDVGSSSQEDPPIMEESSSSGIPFYPVPPNPVGQSDYYLDATLDEVAIFATRLIDEEAESLWNHLVEGAQDGDRWYVDDPNLRIVSGLDILDEFGDVRGDRLSDPATGEWEGYKEYFADWRRDAVTGEYGWYFHPVQYSGVFWNQETGRLDSWLPDEYYELWGDYGVRNSGSFNIG